MNARRFEFVDPAANSDKFWEVTTIECLLRVRWGRRNTNGQTKDKQFATPDAAEREARSLIKEKTGKGYTETSPIGAQAPVGKPLLVLPKVPTLKTSTPKSTPATEPVEIAERDISL